MFRLAKIFAIVMMFSLPGLNAFAADVVIDKVVAVVDGDLITLFDLNKKIDEFNQMLGDKAIKPNDPNYAELRKMVLNTMIDDILIRQEAARLKATVSETDVEQRIRDIKAQSKMSEEQFQQQLKLEGMTKQQLITRMRREMTKQRLIGYMVQRKVIVTEEELKNYYDNNISSLNQSVGTRLSLIIMNKLDEAKALKKRIASNQISFAEAARKYSIGPGAQEGGDIGPVKVDDLAPPIQAALKNLPLGSVSEPVVMEGKPMLVVLNSGLVGSSGSLSFEQAKSEIQEKLFREKMELKFKEYMDKLRSKALVEIK